MYQFYLQVLVNILISFKFRGIFSFVKCLVFSNQSYFNFSKSFKFSSSYKCIIYVLISIKVFLSFLQITKKVN